MLIQRAYKTELNPNNQQRSMLLQYAGAARWVYNWGLGYQMEAHNKGEIHLGAQRLDSVLRNRSSDIAPWLNQVPSHVRQSALADLERAYQNFFRRVKTGGNPGFPKFKSRHHGIGGFRVYAVTIDENRIRLPRIGWVRLKETGYVPTGRYGDKNSTRRILGTTVSERAGRWYVSVQVEESLPDPASPPTLVNALHCGIKVLATDAQGRVFKNPKPLHRSQRKLRRLNKALSRKQPGSANRRKAKAKLATCHAHIADVRRHAQHHVSHVITRKPSVIVLEAWNVFEMMEGRLARGISDAGWAEMLRQVEYKSARRGGAVVKAPVNFPTSRTCSECGVISKLPPPYPAWTCRSCGTRHDREENAVANLLKLAGSRPESQNACGEEGSGSQSIVSETSLGEAGSGQPTSDISPATAENGGIPMCDLGHVRPSPPSPDVGEG